MTAAHVHHLMVDLLAFRKRQAFGACPECHRPYENERDMCAHADGCQLGIWEAEDDDFYANESAQRAKANQ